MAVANMKILCETALISLNVKVAGQKMGKMVLRWATNEKKTEQKLQRFRRDILILLQLWLRSVFSREQVSNT